MSGWKKYRLDQIGKIVTGKTPKTSVDGYWNGDVPFVTPGDIQSTKHIEHTARYVTEDGLFSVKGATLPAGAICVSCIGVIGYASVTTKECVSNQQINSVIVNKEFDADFIYYVLRNNWQAFKNMEGFSSVVSILNKATFSELEFSVPPLSTQKKIAAVLGALDDKIENNRKICKTLEEQAQAIFKSWFVDFDPFGGKRPDGWKDGSLTDIAVYQNGLAMQKFRPEDGDDGVPVLKIRELRAGDCDAESERCRCDIDDRVKIHSGDVIFSWSGSLLVDVWTGCDAGLNQHLFKVTSDKYEPWFFYFWTKHHLAGFIKIAADKATTMGHIQREHLESAKVLIPNDDQLKKLSSILAPVYERMVFANKESRALAELRDALLPKLMSGEIDVEKVVV